MTNPERYHLTLTVTGRPVMHGWWGEESTARSQFRSWVGEHGLPGARIALVDEASGRAGDLAGRDVAVCHPG